MGATEAKEELLQRADDTKRQILERFFKTAPGCYGAGDCFAGIPVPVTRSIAKKYTSLSTGEVSALLHDPIHECRLLGLLIWVEQFKKTKSEKERFAIYNAYLAHTSCINNWDLVDLSAYQIVGRYLKEKERTPLFALAKSALLWEQRIAIVATWEYIRQGEFAQTLALATELRNHPHDLIRKAVGWMLREVGKRDKRALCSFLEQYAHEMPRVMLSYALEKFSLEERAYYRSL